MQLIRYYILEFKNAYKILTFYLKDKTIVKRYKRYEGATPRRVCDAAYIYMCGLLKDNGYEFKPTFRQGDSWGSYETRDRTINEFLDKFIDKHIDKFHRIYEKNMLNIN